MRRRPRERPDPSGVYAISKRSACTGRSANVTRDCRWTNVSLQVASCFLHDEVYSVVSCKYLRPDGLPIVNVQNASSENSYKYVKVAKRGAAKPRLHHLSRQMPWRSPTRRPRRFQWAGCLTIKIQMLTVWLSLVVNKWSYPTRHCCNIHVTSFN